MDSRYARSDRSLHLVSPRTFATADVRRINHAPMSEPSQVPGDSVLRALCRALNCQRVSVIVSDVTPGAGPSRLLMRVYHPIGSEADAQAKFAESQPLRPLDPTLEADQVQTDQNCQMRGLLWRDGRQLYTIEVSRSGELPAFSLLEISDFEALLPGLRLGLHAVMHCPAAGLANTVLEKLPLGVALIGADRSLSSTNRAMRTFLRRGDGLILDRGLLRAREDTDQFRLLRGLRQVTDGGLLHSDVLNFNRTPQRPPYLAILERYVGPISPEEGSPPVAKLTLVDPDHTDSDAVARASASYGLTPTETAVVHAILKGLDVTACAERLELATNTVRWHLKRIFAKTATSGRPALIILFMRGTQLLGG